MKVYITDCDRDNVNIEKEVLKKAGIDLILKKAVSEDEVIEQCKDGEIFIVQYAKITRKVMENCPDLKYIVRYGVGVDTVDVEAATELGIQVGNVPDYGMNEVADHAISLALCFLRKINMMNNFTKNDKWDYTEAIPIYRFSTLTVGVVGLGIIGSNFAKKMSALGFKVIGFDPYKKNIKELDFVKMVDFEGLLKDSDFISIHCPADNNIDLFDKDAFSKMKKTSFIINTSRGGIINEEALEWALSNEIIAGACLDCMINEPVDKSSLLFKHENVIVSPHIAWYSEESAQELKRKVAEEAVRFAKGEDIHYPINKIR
ncbi:C-terminal binding protein [uncultured Anaerococcus sp.]|uniref:C-terminal binding protein n=1 Tax=uncultured Anaerococcus sp. TaxID=293428 RepID=UPI00288A6313|nr:C-terminal binding protein [uncultured Anaerococcus sp.]